ncbi:exportin-2 [Oryza glaberrima]|uniref:Importin N-terminal domain-containing protein n=1 Tax=Oryza glaberrima TaxID=4538 RepID=I1NLM9_ORYGL|nr:exportin-2 [Oryza glaberrima]
MEVAPETLDTLAGWFAQSLSPDAAARRAAEQSIESAKCSPGFGLALLGLASSPRHDPQSRLAASVQFKNLLRRRWPKPSPDGGGDDDADHLPPSDCAIIKANLLQLLLTAPPLIQAQLSEALAAAAASDFPARWESLLPSIVSSLGTALSAGDIPATNSLLAAAASLFSRFRNAFDSNFIRLDLKYCLENFAAPLLEVFLSTSRRLQAAAPTVTPPESRPVFECLRLCCEIFYSLNSIDLPEFFEDHMREWMTEFRAFLTTSYPPAIEADGAPDALRAAVCDNLQLYMEKYEEEFRGYLKEFVEAVWGLLMAPSVSPSRGQLAVTAIRFLTTVAESVHHALFGSPEAMKQICDSVVVPNLRLRDDDEELFEGNWVEYVRRDAEGSDADTLRRAACRLLRGLAANYREQVAALVSAQVQQMLAAYAADRTNNWKEKDAAIYLVISLMQKPGATGGGTPVVDMESFFTSVIVPELQAPDWESEPMLKATVLRFLKEFKDQIPKSTALALLPSVIRFLIHESNVVHSYAATFIENLLIIKDMVPVPSANVITRAPRYVAADINPYAQPIVQNLSKALSFPESYENPYLMKCLMRVLGIANIAGQIVHEITARLVGILMEVCNNPKNPDFNHYLFEALAAVIGRAGEQDPALLPVFEASLFPVLQRILVEDISEFWPYAFQIFAQLVNLSRPPLSQNYMQLFGVLLSNATWDRPPCVPALVRLLRAFLRKIPNELNQEGRLPNILVIFRSLLSRSSTEDSAFYMLNTLVENVSFDIMNPHINEIWSALFTRLQTRQAVKFVNSLVVFMSLVVVKYGPGVLVSSVDAIQPNIFMTILQRFWIPNLKFIKGTVEVKLTSVASTKLICESALLLDGAAAQTWGKLLDSIVALLSRTDQDGAQQDQNDGADADSQRTSGYSVSFVRLQYAGKSEDDLLKEVNDPKQFLVTSLATLSAQSPGRFGPIIEQNVDPANKGALIQLCAAYNTNIV